MSEDLPHKSGITTWLATTLATRILVGRLAPQIGDYDLTYLPSTGSKTSRKTCPTNRGLRHYSCLLVEPLHRRKTCPTNRGLRPCVSILSGHLIRRKTCPTNRGLRLSVHCQVMLTYRRKTCPTNRGLRLTIHERRSLSAASEDLPHKSGITTLAICDNGSTNNTSEDLPHKSGITTLSWSSCRIIARRKTCPTNRGLRPCNNSSKTVFFVGRLAPQIGDYDFK